jgi:small redox-active disulfide protein 2
MLIQVLGTGCTKCKTLYEMVKKTVQETGVDAEVEKVEDIQQILAYELIMTPGLVINGEVKVAGRLPSVEEIKKLILVSKAA